MKNILPKMCERPGWRSFLRGLTAMVSLYLLTLSSANGTLIAHESFGGTSGSTIYTPRTPDAGLSAWVKSGSGVNITLQDGTPSDYPGVLDANGQYGSHTTGNSASTSTATLLSPQTAGGTDIWVGYLARHGNNATTPTHATGFGSSGLTELVVTSDGSVWSVSGSATTVSVTDWTYFVLNFRLSDTAGADVVDWYVNPDASQTTLTTADSSYGGTLTGDYGISQVRMTSRGGSHWDEIRIGTDFQSVAVPEPTSLLLLVFGVGTAALVRRRRTRSV